MFLPPVGKMELPDPKLLVEKFLLRQEFRPDPQGTNLMFGFFAQHFTHQFFKTHNRMGLGFTKGLGHGVSSYLRSRKMVRLCYKTLTILRKTPSYSLTVHIIILNMCIKLILMSNRWMLGISMEITLHGSWILDFTKMGSWSTRYCYCCEMPCMFCLMYMLLLLLLLNFIRLLAYNQLKIKP